MTKFEIAKNVHYVTINLKETTPYMHALVTNLVLENNGKHVAFSPNTEHVIFQNEEDLTEFLDQVGLKTRIVDINIVK